MTCSSPPPPAGTSPVGSRCRSSPAAGPRPGSAGTRRTRCSPTRTPAAYSDLAQLDGSTVGILFETGTTTWKERIEFRSVRILDVI